MLQTLQQQQEISKQQAALLAYQMQKDNPNSNFNTNQTIVRSDSDGEGEGIRDRNKSVLGPQSEGEWTSNMPKPQDVVFSNIYKEFNDKVQIDTLFKLVVPENFQGNRVIDEKRSKLFIAKYRDCQPNEIDDRDPGLVHLIGKDLNELRLYLTNCPQYAVRQMKGNRMLSQEQDENKKVDFLNMFLRNCNIKAIYSKLQQEFRNPDPRLDTKHARILIANLREASFGQVLEIDKGVTLLEGKTQTELRNYLSNITLGDLRSLDLKSYHMFSSTDTPQGPPIPMEQNGPDVYGNNIMSNNNNNNNNNYNNMNNDELQEGGNFGMSVPLPTDFNNFNNNNNNHNRQPSKIEIPVIKVDYNGNIRRFRPHTFQCYKELYSFINNTWSHLHSFALVYIDDENETIGISSDQDLQEGLRQAIESGNKSLRVRIDT